MSSASSYEIAEGILDRVGECETSVAAGQLRMSSKMQVLCLYRKMLSEAGKFPAYNYRNYAIRRIAAAFREHRDVKDDTERRQLIEQAEDSLRMLQRQILVNTIYQGAPLVVDKTK